MNRNLEAASGRTRFAAVLVAILCTVMLGSGIDGLASHYHGQAAEQAARGQIMLATR